MPSSLKFEDSDFMKYRHIPVNWEIKSVSEDCLPEEFSPMAVKLVDMFRRKTIDLPYEIMLIFDYKTGDLIYCFVNDDGSGDEVFGVVDEDILFGRNICIIHNHPIEYGSSPSSENFQILGLKFHDYEIISSNDEIWIIESKELLSENEINDIRDNIQHLYLYSSEIAESSNENENEIIKQCDELYGNLLLRYINNHHLNIKLTKQVL
ncbi:MAG: hypothetical protein IJ122_00455 [Methanobrevibacter sp.]|nr:hypothetical protein [Methanobrevibacter sp.]